MHRWSGWPGAWCLDCGIEDPIEVCLAVHDTLDYECINCGEHWPQGVCSSTQEDHVVKEISCPDHPQTKCTEPNSHGYDPYYHWEDGTYHPLIMRGEK